jgi:very-short-patch-repair endonuclease
MSLGRIAALFLLGAVLIFSLRKVLGQIGLGRRSLQVRPVPLMTQAERRVMAYIEEALPGARVHAQVSMGAIMQPARLLGHREATITRNRFSSKRVDFVVEDRASGRILALIELDDWSHSTGNDQWRDRLTASAGYRTIRLPAGERQTSETVRRRIHAALFAPSATP